MTLLLSAVTPGLGQVIGRGQFAKAAALRGEMLALSWLSSAVCGSTILLWNRSLLHLWVGPENYAGPWANLLIVLMMAQTVFIRGDAFVIDATLRLRERVLVSGAAAALSIGLAVTLIPALGISGLCLGVIAGRLTQSVAYPFLLSACLNQPHAYGLRHIARAGSAGGLLFAGSLFFGEQILAKSWIECAFGVGVSVIVLTGVAFYGGLSSNFRVAVLGRLRMVMHGPGGAPPNV
jgi:hypothetical protein